MTSCHLLLSSVLSVIVYKEGEAKVMVESLVDRYLLAGDTRLVNVWVTTVILKTTIRRLDLSSLNSSPQKMQMSVLRQLTRSTQMDEVVKTAD